MCLNDMHKLCLLPINALINTLLFISSSKPNSALPIIANLSNTHRHTYTHIHTQIDREIYVEQLELSIDTR